QLRRRTGDRERRLRGGKVRGDAAVSEPTARGPVTPGPDEGGEPPAVRGSAGRPGAAGRGARPVRAVVRRADLVASAADSLRLPDAERGRIVAERAGGGKDTRRAGNGAGPGRAVRHPTAGGAARLP